jgi:hypothetical protein
VQLINRLPLLFLCAFPQTLYYLWIRTNGGWLHFNAIKVGVGLILQKSL